MSQSEQHRFFAIPFSVILKSPSQTERSKTLTLVQFKIKSDKQKFQVS